LDGTISAPDLTQLEQHLQSHEESQPLARQVAALGQSLAAPAPTEVPTELEARIRVALDAARPPTSLRAAGSTTVKRFSWRSQLLPLAAGLLLGAALGQLLHLIPGRPVDGSRAVGSMAATEVARGPAAVAVDLGADVGRLNGSRSGELITIDLELAAGARVQVAVHAGDGPLQLISATASGSGQSSARDDGTGLVLEADGPGRSGLTARAASEEAVAHLKVRVDGELVRESRLEAYSGNGL
jgi:hypothetical protein